MKRIAILLLVGFAATQASAQDTVFGTWCEDGWGVVIDAEGMGDFEHTVCTYETPQPSGRSLSSPMVCKVYHYQDDGTAIETNSFDYDLTAVLIDDNTVSLDYGDGRGSFALSRCEDE